MSKLQICGGKSLVTRDCWKRQGRAFKTSLTAT